MKLPHLICSCLLILPLTLRAQEQAAGDATAQEGPIEDPIEAAIRAFHQREKDKPNEVTVVLEPEGQPPAEEPQDGKTDEQPETGNPQPEETVPQADGPAPQDAQPGTGQKPDDQDKPVLVTGRPPSSPDLLDVTNLGEADAGASRESIRIRVEKVRDGIGQLDASKVKLLAPFPPKPLMDTPPGWHLENCEGAPLFEREVELAPGKTITLSIAPHVLAPDTDGKSHFQVQEPGFQASQGYRQSDTVPAILSRSIRQLETDSRQIGAAVDRLQELLVALPKPESAQPLPGNSNAKPKKP